MIGKSKIELKAAAFDMLCEMLTKNAMPVASYKEIVNTPQLASNHFKKNSIITGAEECLQATNVIIKEVRIAWPVYHGNLAQALVNKALFDEEA